MSGPNFAQRRMVSFALLFGMASYTLVAAVVVQSNDGKGLLDAPLDGLDAAVPLVAAGTAATALLLRRQLRARVVLLPPGRQARARLAALLVPLAAIEAGCLFGTTAWLLNGTMVPGLAAALLLFALAVLITPFQADADEG